MHYNVGKLKFSTFLPLKMSLCKEGVLVWMLAAEFIQLEEVKTISEIEIIQSEHIYLIFKAFQLKRKMIEFDKRNTFKYLLKFLTKR